VVLLFNFVFSETGTGAVLLMGGYIPLVVGLEGSFAGAANAENGFGALDASGG